MDLLDANKVSSFSEEDFRHFTDVRHWRWTTAVDSLLADVPLEPGRVSGITRALGTSSHLLLVLIPIKHSSSAVQRHPPTGSMWCKTSIAIVGQIELRPLKLAGKLHLKRRTATCLCLIKKCGIIERFLVIVVSNRYLHLLP